MPPVAETFIQLVDELLDRGQMGITSTRALAQRMHELDPRQSAENWRTSLRRYRDGVNPREETIALAAEALGVPREIFPLPVTRQSRLEELAATLADSIEEQNRLSRRIREIEARLRALEDPDEPDATAPKRPTTKRSR